MPTRPWRRRKQMADDWEEGVAIAVRAAVIAAHGDLTEAEKVFQQALDVLRDNNGWGVANVLYGLGQIARARRDLGAAAEYFGAALSPLPADRRAAGDGPLPGRNRPDRPGRGRPDRGGAEPDREHAAEPGHRAPARDRARAAGPGCAGQRDRRCRAGRQAGRRRAGRKRRDRRSAVGVGDHAVSAGWWTRPARASGPMPRRRCSPRARR